MSHYGRHSDQYSIASSGSSSSKYSYQTNTNSSSSSYGSSHGSSIWTESSGHVNRLPTSKHDNRAVRFAVHILRGPFAGAQPRKRRDHKTNKHAPPSPRSNNRFTVPPRPGPGGYSGGDPFMRGPPRPPPPPPMPPGFGGHFAGGGGGGGAGPGPGPGFIHLNGGAPGHGPPPPDNAWRQAPSEWRGHGFQRPGGVRVVD